MRPRFMPLWWVFVSEKSTRLAYRGVSGDPIVSSDFSSSLFFWRLVRYIFYPPDFGLNGLKCSWYLELQLDTPTASACGRKQFQIYVNSWHFFNLHRPILNPLIFQKEKTEKNHCYSNFIICWTSFWRPLNKSYSFLRVFFGKKNSNNFFSPSLLFII